jgi:rubredoxin
LILLKLALPIKKEKSATTEFGNLPKDFLVPISPEKQKVTKKCRQFCVYELAPNLGDDFTPLAPKLRSNIQHNWVNRRLLWAHGWPTFC